MTTTPTPIPGTERVVHGTCHHDCPDSCGWEVTVRDGVAVELRGNPAHPYSAGELCPKVNRFLGRVYNPERITTPLRRVGAKGEGHFEPIDWPTALDEIATRFRTIIETHGAEAIVPFSSAGNQSLLALFFGERLWNRLGVTQLTGALCGATAGAGAAVTMGTPRSLDPQELCHAKLIILWGTNTRLTNRHLWPTIEAARAAGAEIVVIDPLRTITAEAADRFLQPLPGTDVALMLAIMHVLVRDDLVDHDWIDRHTHGFDELVAHVADWTPVRAAEVCGLDADEIERLAHDYGTTRPSALRTLIGAEHHEHGAMFFRTLACLPALVGDWRHRGGGYSRSVGTWSNQLVDFAALTAAHLASTGANEGRAPARTLPMVRMAEWLNDASLHPGVHALVVTGANPVVSVPNSAKVERGLARADLFTVVHEQFLTDTARYADIVLPATTHVEAVDVVTAWGHLYLGWNEPAIAPVGDAVSNSELFRRLAAALGLDDPELFTDDISALRAALPAIDLDELRRRGFTRVPYPDDGRPFGDDPVFPTPSGKVEFVVDPTAGHGLAPLPTYTPAHESSGGDPTLFQRHPFVLLTPKQHVRFLNSSYSHLPGHGDREGGPRVDVHPLDASALGVDDGSVVRVHNDRGEVVLPVRISERVRPGVVSAPWGWWGPRHHGGHSINALTNDAITDWGGGVAYGDTLVSITPLTDDTALRD